MPRVTLLLASLHALLFVVLSLRISLHRKARGIGIGAGGDEVLTRKVRVHANFVEYVPLALLLLLLLELSGAAPALLWTLGLALLLARLLHAVGLGASAGYTLSRFAGALLTYVVLLALALAGVYRFVLTAG